jgi:hypothetical protein
VKLQVELKAPSSSSLPEFVDGIASLFISRFIISDYGGPVKAIRAVLLIQNSPNKIIDIGS